MLGPAAQLLQALAEVAAQQAVKQRVEAAVGVRQADGHREEVGLHQEVGAVPGHRAQLDQHPPERKRLVGQPAEHEGQQRAGQRSGNPGATSGRAPGWPAHPPPPQEAQKQQRAGAQRDQRQHKGHGDLLQMVGQPVGTAVGEAQQAQAFAPMLAAVANRVVGAAARIAVAQSKLHKQTAHRVPGRPGRSALATA